jgi:uncharacterized membrane protein YjgN (DUF898 family)
MTPRVPPLEAQPEEYGADIVPAADIKEVEGVVQRQALPEEEIRKLAEEHSGGDVKKRNGIGRVLGQVPEILDNLFRIIEEGDFRPLREQVVQFTRYSVQALQENPLSNDITRGLLALFFIIQLYARLQSFKIESWAGLLMHVVAVIFSAHVVDWVLRFMNLMQADSGLRRLMFAFYNRKFRQKAKEIVLTLGKEQIEGQEEDTLPALEGAGEIVEAVPGALTTWREGMSEILYEKVVKRAEQVLSTGVAITFYLGKQSVRMNVALARFIMNDPFIMLGAAVGLILGEFIPLHQSVAEWTRQTIWNTLRTIVWLPPEMTLWQNLMFKAKNTLAGAAAGVLGEIITINLIKILYGLAYEAQRRYNIPDKEALRNLLMLTARATRLAVEAPKYETLSDQAKKAFKKEQLAIKNQWEEVRQQLPAIEAPKPQPKPAPFPYPFTEGMLPPLALEGPKQAKVKAKVSKSSSSEGEFENPSLTDAEDFPSEDEYRKGLKAATSKKKQGKGFIRGQTLQPIDERMQIGSAAPLPYLDITNDSFLIKPKR